MTDIKDARLNKELKNFSKSPPKGISLCLKNSQTNNLEATISSLEETPYEGGIFHLEVQLPDNYPFSPPQIRFITPVYHPNIDAAGRICLDVLKDTEHGAWKPSLGICTLLLSIQMLLKEPNHADPLMPEIANELKNDKNLFETKAKQHTKLHALPQTQAATEGIPETTIEKKYSEDGSSLNVAQERKVVSKLGIKRKIQETT